MEASFKHDVKFIAKIGRKSETWEVLRAFPLHDRMRDALPLFADQPIGEKLQNLFDALKKSKRWQAELEARRRYEEIVTPPPSEAMIPKLEVLRAEAPDTEYGGNRTREKLLALQG